MSLTGFGMWSVTKLDDNDLQLLLNREESQFFDFKDKSSIGKCTKTISAFANTDGGELCVGVRDKKESNRICNLFSSLEEANDVISNILKQFDGGVEFVGFEFLFCEGLGYILMVTVQKTPFVVKSSDGKVFKRQNASDRELKAGQEISSLELEKGIRSFEDSATSLDCSEIQESSKFQEFLRGIVPNSTPIDFLRKERLVYDERVKTCAVLLFDENPQSILPQASIKVYRYTSLGDEGEREDLEGQPESIEGNICDQIYSAVSRVKEKVEQIPILGEAGFVQVKYPQEAVHEVICNAVLHRDYSIRDYVHVRIFDNRIEVESPGKLAGPVTVKNILKQRFSRNNKLVRLIAKFPSPPNKDVGEGLNTAFRAMQSLNLGRPVIEETEASVIVRLKHEPLASKEEIVKKYLQKNLSINNAVARNICNIQSDSIIRKMFRAMIVSGEIEKIPETRGKGTKYRICASSEDWNVE